MAYEAETLEALFDLWNELLRTSPTDDEREQLKRIPLYTMRDKDYFQREREPEYYAEWRAQLPAYYRRKADVMLAILTRLKAHEPIQWIVSEIKEDIPQLAYFLFVRHLELFVLKDPLQLQKYPTKPEWLLNLERKGVTLEEINALLQETAFMVVQHIIGVTEGLDRYGDLPRNAPHPRIIEVGIEMTQTPRYLDGIHEYVEDTVLANDNP